MFADGCFICQPTVCFRRTMTVLLGDLDVTLAAAFDFEYWLRAFGAFPDRIGYIGSVQAQSRLHEGCITRRNRRDVAVESTRVLARHLGWEPAHWVLTYLEEMQQDPAWNDTSEEDMESVVQEVAQFVTATEEHKLKQGLLNAGFGRLLA